MARRDIKIKQGALYESFFKFREIGSSTFLDLSPYTFTAEIRDRQGGNLLATMAIAVITPEIRRIRLLPSESALLIPRQAVWDLKMLETANPINVSYPFEGIARIIGRSTI